MDIKVKLSTLWVFVIFNYLYADVLTIFDALFSPGSLAQLTTGDGSLLRVTQEFLLGAAVLMELAIAMVFLSRVLKYRANRWANIIVGSVETVAVLATLFVGTPTLYYLFFSTIEVACTSSIVWFAWRWPGER